MIRRRYGYIGGMGLLGAAALAGSMLAIPRLGGGERVLKDEPREPPIQDENLSRQQRRRQARRAAKDAKAARAKTRR